MQFHSIYRSARISAFKCREVTRAIQGLPVGIALDLLGVTPKKAARLVLKTLRSAIANAESNNNLSPNVLTVREALVGEGATMKRFRPKARGSAGPVRKRTSHIKIVLTDELEDLPKRIRVQTHATGSSANVGANVGVSPAQEFNRRGADGMENITS